MVHYGGGENWLFTAEVVHNNETLTQCKSSDCFYLFYQQSCPLYRNIGENVTILSRVTHPRILLFCALSAIRWVWKSHVKFLTKQKWPPSKVRLTVAKRAHLHGAISLAFGEHTMIYGNYYLRCDFVSYPILFHCTVLCYVEHPEVIYIQECWKKAGLEMVFQNWCFSKWRQRWLTCTRETFPIEIWSLKISWWCQKMMNVLSKSVPGIL